MPAHLPVCRHLSPNRSFSACASPSVSPGVNASTSVRVSASASTSGFAPPRVSPTDNSSISGTVSASVSTSHCALPSLSPSVTQQVIQCVRIAQCVARFYRLHLWTSRVLNFLSGSLLLYGKQRLFFQLCHVSQCALLPPRLVSIKEARIPGLLTCL